MNLPSPLRSIFRRSSRKTAVLGLLGVAALIAAIVLVSRTGSSTPVSSSYEVKRGNFMISVVEGGTLEAVNEVSVRSEVEGTCRIIYIVPEGTYVKKNDLLVELDSAAAQETVNQQEINVEKAQFAVVQSQQQLEIQKSVVDSDTQAAELKKLFADLDLQKFNEAEKEQTRRNAHIDITNIKQDLSIAQDRLTWTKKLYEKGFETKANLDKDQLTVSQSELKLEQAQKNLDILIHYDELKKQEQLKSALQQAQDDLARTKLQGSRKLDQYKADLASQKRTLDLSQKKLDHDLQQLEATKIYAPQDGLVVYASGPGRFSSESLIEEGAIVRNRQELIKLPDVSQMKLEVKIHESHINQIQIGQPAYVVLDSMPDFRFRGVVDKVAPLPDSQSRWGNPNLKVYATDIVVTDKLPDIKPGVSARAEVIITNLTDVLTIPIQAVTTRKGKQVVFLADNQPMPVTVGMYNTKFIEVTSGLKAGDQVLLSPPFDSDEKDLGGAILASGEEVPKADTNYLARTSKRGAISEKQRAKSGKRLAELSPIPTLSAAEPSKNAERGSNSKQRQDHAGESTKPAPERPVDAQPTARTAQPGADKNQSTSLTREEALKRFDKNGDGQLDENERATMRASLARDLSRHSSSPAGAQSQ